MAPADTSPEAYRAQIDAYRRLDPTERARLAFAMSEEARELARAGIRARHGDYDAARVESALRRLLLGDDLYRAAWPEAPLVDP